ncbi:MAG: XrtA-associated ATPase [Azoarcus sp.]|jgi:putative secretion ATPase (PEP-CTERM system associated)|nr:XrtA-associated ATPase [Azoarcus sp.]
MYETFFGFGAKPFQLNPDPSFLFGSRGHRRAMAYLEYGLHRGEGFIVITGEVGAGKTTIVRSLLERIDGNRIVTANITNTLLDAREVLRMVATAFGIPARGPEKTDLLLAIETFLVKITSQGKRALLIVDEAQNLGPAALEELRMLSNFQLEDHSLLQSFLVGQPEFRSIMQSAGMRQLRQRVIATYHLGPLDAAETQAYVLHRLRRVGWKNDPKFDPAVFGRIFEYSGGVPRRINSLCDRLLLDACLAERHEIGAGNARAVIAELYGEFSTLPAVTDGNEPPAAAGVVTNALREMTNEEAPPGRLAADSLNRRLEARLSRVEQSVSAALSVVNQLAQTIRREDNSESLR